jgi:toxin ParE1/3/4
MGTRKFREVRFTDLAIEDLESILDYFEKAYLPARGQACIKKLVSRTERLARFPNSGRVVPEYGLPWIREVIVPPYRMVYRNDLGHIQIIRVQRSEKLLRFKKSPKLPLAEINVFIKGVRSERRTK